MMSSTKQDIIKLPVPKKTKNKLNERLDFVTSKGSHIIDYSGTQNVENLFMLYMLKKYKSDCFIRYKKGLGEEEEEEERYNHLLGLTLVISFEPGYKRNFFRSCDNLAQQIVNCIKRETNIIIIPLFIVVHEHDGSKDKRTETGEFVVSSHANFLIYRKTFNHIEHYEPHGKCFQLDPLGHEAIFIAKMIKHFVGEINNKLKKNSLPTIKLVTTEETCPMSSGFQAFECESTLPIDKLKEPGGYCSAWSMFFIELCLKNPEIPITELIDRIYSRFSLLEEENTDMRAKFSDYLRVLVRGYANIIDEKIKQTFSIQFGEEINVNKLKHWRNDVPRFKKIESKIADLVDLEILLSGQNGQNYADKIESQILKTEGDIDIILRTESPNPKNEKALKKMTKDLEMLNTLLNDYRSHLSLENIKHSSSSIEEELEEEEEEEKIPPAKKMKKKPADIVVVDLVDDSSSSSFKKNKTQKKPAVFVDLTHLDDSSSSSTKKNKTNKKRAVFVDLVSSSSSSSSSKKNKTKKKRGNFT
jgi:hypothetical protein